MAKTKLKTNQTQAINKVSRIKSIQDVNDSELALIISQSSLLLQKKNNGLNGELKSSGNLVENYIKDLVKKHIPKNYRLCSGYIATTDSIYGSNNLLQHDLIIVDNRIPALYQFGVSDIEIVSAESVCGIIELKRTLSRKSIIEAINHLKQTYDMLENYDNGIKSKLSGSNLVGLQSTSATHAPLYAIIGLEWGNIRNIKKFEEDILEENIKKFIDMIWALSSEVSYSFGFGTTTPSFTTRIKREDNQEYCVIKDSQSDEKSSCGKVYRLSIALLRTWINNCIGSPLDEKKNHDYFQSFKNEEIN